MASMRMLIAATCSAGAAVVLASPAIAADSPPSVPSTAAIAQYIEAVPSSTGPVPIGGAASPAVSTPLATGVRAKVERTAGADAPALLDLAQDSRFGARPVRRANPTRGAPAIPPQVATASIGTPSPLAAAASTAGSGELLLVALLLAGITAAGIAAKAARR